MFPSRLEEKMMLGSCYGVRVVVARTRLYISLVTMTSPSSNRSYPLRNMQRTPRKEDWLRIGVQIWI